MTKPFKITQKMIAFYKLYDSKRKKENRFIPAWEFVGEMYIPELKQWYLASYKAPTRLTDLWQENPGLFDRELIKGKSGSEYFGYKFSSMASSLLIKDKKLLQFYKLIKERRNDN